MKKRIVISIALLMILCLALAGCGQKSSNTANESNNQPSESYGETSINDNSEEIDDVDNDMVDVTNDEHEDTTVKPSDGLYTYELHGGVKISCNTNVWDYIDGNYFNFRAMAHDLGYERDSNDYASCAAFYHDLPDGSYIRVSLQDANSSDEIFPYIAINWYKSSNENMTRCLSYNKTDAIYQVNSNPGKVKVNGPHFSIDAIYLMAYSLEHFYSEYPNDIYADIFGDYYNPNNFAGLELYELP